VTYRLLDVLEPGPSDQLRMLAVVVAQTPTRADVNQLTYAWHVDPVREHGEAMPASAASSVYPLANTDNRSKTRRCVSVRSR